MIPCIKLTKLTSNWFLGNKEDNLPSLVNIYSKMIHHCNKGPGNKMSSNMALASLMSVVEAEAYEKGCWAEIKFNGVTQEITR